MPLENILIGVAIFLFLAILASKAAHQVGVPALLLFLVLGMLAGSDGPGGIYFDYPQLAQSVGVVALAFILFAGGLDTPWRDVPLALRPALSLSTLGVAITALSVGWFAHTFLGFSWAEGILLGAIISSTDAAAVFAVLRGKGVHLKGRIKPLIEMESGSNDPMAVFLTIGMIQLVLDPTLSAASLLPLFIQQMALGALTGLLLGRAAVTVINRIRLEYDGLYPVLTVALVVLTYGLTAWAGGNGFLAVYLVGLMLSRQEFVHKRSLNQFHDGLAWLMQIVMFVTLGLQVFPSQLIAIAPEGLMVSAFLILLARPLSVFISLAGTRFRRNEKLFISWVGLRGAAPIVLATFPMLAGVAKADMIFNLVFFIVITSVLLQGRLLITAARLFRVQSDVPVPKSPLAYVMQDGMISNNLIEVTILPTSPAVGKQIVELELPRDTLIVLIGREQDTIVPRGDTIIKARDRLLLLTHEASDVFKRIFG